MAVSKEFIVELKYDTIKGVICTTPCPYRFKDDGGRIFVGSTLCEACSSHIEKDRENKTVMCHYSDFTSEKYKQKAFIEKNFRKIEEEKNRRNQIRKSNKCT